MELIIASWPSPQDCQRAPSWSGLVKYDGWRSSQKQTWNWLLFFLGKQIWLWGLWGLCIHIWRSSLLCSGPFVSDQLSSTQSRTGPFSNPCQVSWPLPPNSNFLFQFCQLRLMPVASALVSVWVWCGLLTHISIMLASISHIWPKFWPIAVKFIKVLTHILPKLRMAAFLATKKYFYDWVLKNLFVQWQSK